MRTIASIVAAGIIASAPLLAQGTPTASVTTVAPIYLKPGAEIPLRVAAVGTSLNVLKEEGDWAQVEFNDPQYGRRVGWVQVKLIRIFRPELQPLDLSVRDTSPAREVPPAREPEVQQLPAAVRNAQVRQDRGWFDINFGAASSAQSSLKTELNQVDVDGETHHFGVGYNAPTGASFDIGAGMWLTRTIGAGLSLTGTAHRGAANLDIRIPHPLFFNAYATDVTLSDGELERTEGGVNLSMAARFPSANNKVVFKVYGGPTYFRLTADAARDIRYNQQFGIFNTSNTVEISTVETKEVEETAWGFHAGGDVGYFFSNHVGVGGFARISRGSMTVEDADVLADGPAKVKLGGFQAGGGLRVRF